MEKHVRPAGKRAGITKRIGWHMLRHTFGTLVNSQGADVGTMKELLRHANFGVLDKYVQAIGENKRGAQSRLVQSIPFPWKQSLFPNVPTGLTDSVATA
jgi:site-specific recombinase XerD